MFVLLIERLICTRRESTYFDSLEQHFKKAPPKVKFISALIFSLVNFISFDPTKKNYVLYRYNKSVLSKKLSLLICFCLIFLYFKRWNLMEVERVDRNKYSWRPSNEDVMWNKFVINDFCWKLFPSNQTNRNIQGCC